MRKLAERAGAIAVEAQATPILITTLRHHGQQQAVCIPRGFDVTDVLEVISVNIHLHLAAQFLP